MLQELQRGDREAFDEAKPHHMVGLYAFFHTRVYGVGPSELADLNTFRGATSAARKMLADEFDGGQLRMVRFMIWVWTREAGQEKQRDSKAKFRIGWRLQFASRYLLTDYRVILMRSRRAKAEEPGKP